MDKKCEALASSLERVVGSGFVTAKPALMIDGFHPSFLVRPCSTEEAMECLHLSGDAGKAVVPAGLGTWLECGNPLRRADVVLSLERMNRIIEYSPPDLTVTVQAGLTLEELNNRTRQERQWLPLDPPGAQSASLGAIAACAQSGPLRLGFGTPRDYVIGLSLAHIDGRRSKAGGRVAKNVAGYDMNKLYVGSFGTLAVLTEITFKLRPLPERFATVLITSLPTRSLAASARRVLDSALLPASIFVTKRAPAEMLSAMGTDQALLIRFAESEAAVKHQIEWIGENLDKEARAITLDDAEAGRVWAQIADIDLLAGNALRLSVPVSAVADLFERVVQMVPDSVAAMDVGTGIIRVAFDADDRKAIEVIKKIRQDARSAGGTVFIERASMDVRQEADAWGDAGAALGLMKSLKSSFDPGSLLNPGRFVSGI